MSSSLPTQDIPVVEIWGDPDFNCRGKITSLDVMDLKTSITQNGLQQPIVVQPHNHPPYKWRVVMGHRRLEAFKSLKREAIPAIIQTGLTDIQARAMNLIENLERKDLTLMQEARAIEKFFIVGLSQEEVMKLIGKSRGWVQVRYTALRLDPLIQKEIDAGFVTQQQVLELYSVPSRSQQFEIVRDIKDRKLRGEKGSLKVKPDKKIQAHEKKIRKVTEIFAMQDKIREMVGNNIGTRCLGWAAGLVSDNELMEDVEKLLASVA